MKKEFAIKARDLTLEALQKLHAIVITEADWSTEDMQEFRRTLGKGIGMIDFDILCSIYKHFPELNDLSEEECRKIDLRSEQAEAYDLSMN